jgi:hypothetical protein
MPGLNLGDTVPDFDAETSVGPIKFHEWIGDRCASTFLCFFGQHILRSGKSSDRTSCIRDGKSEREGAACSRARARWEIKTRVRRYSPFVTDWTLMLLHRFSLLSVQLNGNVFKKLVRCESGID